MHKLERLRERKSEENSVLGVQPNEGLDLTTLNHNLSGSQESDTQPMAQPRCPSIILTLQRRKRR